ncbi:beta-ketoacyl-ACP synthase III [Streptomyces olivochromogenes]|uniref:Beta-ketoacyl-[acyl-carrier-protein] synthase III n=1 Tax=Streptomyces olivochromogenes TaxID=1963 RepID=A0A250V3S7_STROL|nr:beta-ketoacyl-ACP synthase III [Streptomyces olivochromogenes]GAX48833.1 3-oxoacyl-[acyl-carrier-protein] synthase 3 protein 2 [Streptomyces olivochromogenes]
MSAAVVCGIGTCLPERVVSNDDLAARLDTSDAWIRSRTGIARRRIVEPGTSTGDLAVAAGQAALDSAGHGADFVLLATTTPDRPCPATAPEVAHRLGLGEVPAMDVSAVCSGFVYAVTVARSLVASGTCARPLVIGAEVYTSIIDPLDRDTAVIFGDGAGAVVLREGGAAESGALRAVDLGSDGSGGELITVVAGGSRRPRADVELPRSQRYFRMQGRTVYRHAVHRMTASSRLALERAGWSPTSVRAFVGHQANQRILDAVGDRLGIGAPHRFGNIAEVGNTAAASIPLALADTAARDLVRPGERSLLTAFGGGLTWGSIALSWPAAVPVQRHLPVPAARRPAMVPAPASVPCQNGPRP